MVITSLVWMVLVQIPTTPLTGTVLGPGGEAVEGAELVLVGLPSFEAPVVARGKTGEGGRFSIDRPSSLAGDHHPQRAPILWVVKPGFRASATRFPEALPRADESVRVVLEPPGLARVRVEGPDGQPVAGVQVRPERLKAHFTNVPDLVAEIASATTGADGLAVLDAVSPEELAYVDVHSREFGIQGRPVTPDPARPTVILLRAASTWKGRLTSDDPKLVRGWHVKAWARVGGEPNAEPQTTGYVETTTDDQGRFALAPIAVGGLQLELKPPGELPVLVDLPRGLTVREGTEGSAEIPLRRPTILTGLVLERGTGKPVPGVEAMLSYLGSRPNSSGRIKTDDRGRYTLKSLSGKVRVSLLRPPPSHVLAPAQHWVDFDVLEGSPTIELATWEALPAAPPLRGVVRDEAGKPVPGATVQASWMLTGGTGSSGGSIRATSDDRGGFVLEGLGPDSQVTITARLRDQQTKTPLIVRAGEGDLTTLTIAPTPVLAIAGRLLGPGGAPLAGVAVKVQFRVPRNNFAGFPEQARFEGQPEIKTAADGTFRTPKELERKASDFRVEVAADGFLPARTEWIPLPPGDLLTLPDLTLKRSRGIRVVTGQVVDREGKPVAGARVAQSGDGPRWTSVKADADGRFRLTGVAGGEALINAEGPGFRFGGAIVGGEPGAVTIRLARESEPPIASLKTLPSPLPRDEERALARQLLGPVVPLALSGSLGIVNREVIPILARVDPTRVLEMIENRAINLTSGGLIPAVLGQFEVDPAPAIATIGDDLDPASRALGWLALEDGRPRPDRGRREDLLARALLDARATANPEAKVRLLGRVADRWLGLGSLDRARPILLEARAIVATLPKSTWSNDAEEFGEVLAAIDLSAAIALFERQGKTNVSKADEASINRHKGQAAIRLASLDPPGAERLIPPPSPAFYERPGVVLKVARRMAKADLARARKLLETIDDGSRPGLSARPALIPFGLGLMADELAEADPATARALLSEAFAGLRANMVDGRPFDGQVPVANLMAELLPVVERLEPDRLAERAWQVAASRSPTNPEPKAQEVEATFALAMLVARYDRSVAGVIIAPALERLPDLLAESAGSYNTHNAAIIKHLAAYDPRTIIPLIAALPEAARKTPAKPDTWTAASVEAQIRLAAAEILGVPNSARPREAGRSGMMYSPYRLDE